MQMQIPVVKVNAKARVFRQEKNDILKKIKAPDWYSYPGEAPGDASHYRL